MKNKKSVIPFYVFLIVLPLSYAVRINVKTCPVTETAWKARSQMFECTSREVYHCIEDKNETLMEICMVPYLIKPTYEGGCPCASYDSEKGGAILGGVFHSCEGNGCPQKNDSDYWTNELYKYPTCLHHEQTTEVPDSTTRLSINTTITGNDRNESGGVNIQTVIIITMVVILLTVLGWKLLRKRLNCRKKCFGYLDDVKRSSSAGDIDVEADGKLMDKRNPTDTTLGMDVDENSTSTESEFNAETGFSVEEGDKSSDPLICTDERKDSTKMLVKNQGQKWKLSQEDLSKAVIPLLTRDGNGRTVVHKACLEGKTYLVKDWIQNYGDIFNNIKDNKGMTLLHLAGFSGSVELVQYLHENGCSLKDKDNSGQTIVHIVCRKGHMRLLQYLTDIDKSVIYIKDKNGMTAFHYAGFSGSVELVKYLIDIGAEVCCQDFEGRIIVHIACEKGHVDLSELFISMEKEVFNIKDQNGMTPFHYAAFSGSVELVQYLTDNGCDLYSKNANGQTIAHIACGKGHVSLLKYLINIDRGLLEIQDSNGLTPCHFAGFSGSEELVHYLSDKGCDIYNKSVSDQ